MYSEKVTTDGKNGIYGHGKDRYDKIEKVFEASNDQFTNETAWNALIAASQTPKDEDITSNTQWSIVFNNTDKTLEFVLHRNWSDVISYDLNTNQVKK